MCKIFNMVGSLTTLKTDLKYNNINDFKSVKEIISFQNSFSTLRQQIVAQHIEIITQEKNILEKELLALDVVIQNQKQATKKVLLDDIEKTRKQVHIFTSSTSNNIFVILTKNVKVWLIKRRLRLQENNLNEKINKSISEPLKLKQEKNARLGFVKGEFQAAVDLSASTDLFEIERKKLVVDSLNSFIYGALGEQKVVNTLKKLSDEYFLINDFSVSFSPPIYNKQENDTIKSIQIDHILVGPQGIFLIETKNWSQTSLENLNMFSPVQQIKRANYALYKLLNDEIANFKLGLNSHHWGAKKTTLKNIVVFTKIKPRAEFQYVKVLTLNELLGYINYFKPMYSNIETTKIADFLLLVNNHKTARSK